MEKKHHQHQQKNKHELIGRDKIISEIYHSNDKENLAAMQRKIQKLEKTLAQRDSEVWNLRHLLLYR